MIRSAENFNSRPAEKNKRNFFGAIALATASAVGGFGASEVKEHIQEQADIQTYRASLDWPSVAQILRDGVDGLHQGHRSAEQVTSERRMANRVLRDYREWIDSPHALLILEHVSIVLGSHQENWAEALSPEEVLDLQERVGKRIGVQEQ